MSFQFSHSVMSNSLWPHRLQHARFPCPSPTPRACSNSGPSSQWCHPTIFSLCHKKTVEKLKGSQEEKKERWGGGKKGGVGRNSSLMSVSRASPESFKNGLFQVGHLTKCLFSSIIQSYPTLSDPMDCSLPGSSVHGIFQARVLDICVILGHFLSIKHNI